MTQNVPPKPPFENTPEAVAQPKQSASSFVTAQVTAGGPLESPKICDPRKFRSGTRKQFFFEK
jgi:hypothetical protein